MFGDVIWEWKVQYSLFSAQVLVMTAVCSCYHLPDSSFYDPGSLTPTLVDSPPPGVNFTNCVVLEDTGYCCVDLVQIIIIKHRSHVCI